ncbi:MAG: hypothetical protein FWC03_08985 [Treponema sp.]|nr:hypothetical protein [Treponema sp.]
MKKVLFSLVFLVLALTSYAQKKPAGSLLINGTSHRDGLTSYFTERFTEEASASGYIIAGKLNEAEYVLNYVISETSFSEDESEEAVIEQVIKIIIYNNLNDEEILNFEYIFNDIYEMYDYVQFLFQRASISIPLPRKSDLIDTTWQNKLLYLRASFDYPITFFSLQPDGLVGGIGAYEGTFSHPNRVSPQDNKILAMPGATAGIEFQFLNFMSLELNIQLSMGDTRNNYFLNLAAGAELKFPLKFFPHIVIEPYAAFTYPILISDIFSEFPLFSVGGGLQIGTKGGKNGSFFVDAGYMFSFTNAGMNNPYGNLYPQPAVIYYNRSVLKLGIGYKFGIIDRKTGVNSFIKNY